MFLRHIVQSYDIYPELSILILISKYHGWGKGKGLRIYRAKLRTP